MWKSGDRNTKEMYENRELSEEFEKHQLEIDELDMKEEGENQLITDGYKIEQPAKVAKKEHKKEQLIQIDTIEQKVVNEKNTVKPLDAYTEVSKSKVAFDKYFAERKQQ